MSTATVELDIEERVELGAAWLDENRPGWLDRIDLDTLSVEHCDLCILGQIYGDYCDAPDEAKYASIGDATPSRDRGFNAYSGRDEEYEALTVEWRRLIESRRAEVE